jgi:hypothetical protein
MRSRFLGIKLSEEEMSALLNLAEREGLQKSICARRILRLQLVKMGELPIHNPAPQGGVNP